MRRASPDAKRCPACGPLRPVAGSGRVAEQVAELENADTSWSVAGAVFYSGLVGSQDQIVRSYCATHAVKSFENAASLNPGNPEHRINLALVYAENPPPDNPMQAVLMLRELEDILTILLFIMHWDDWRSKQDNGNARLNDWKNHGR